MSKRKKIIKQRIINTSKDLFEFRENYLNLVIIDKYANSKRMAFENRNQNFKLGNNIANVSFEELVTKASMNLKNN
ncbi:hypothetical protein CWI39_0037p0030 [Hamiltosporidium magnivora]|uniref:Uncharacterized protein n=1 Tax=Hamiltosporidium magnivora TaxID=148818 RepID=A0A4V2JWZ0_9MICR|nr:hypothetical protein CWI39_0037p0030 [Hamiltosporidium magnivora]